jgi:transcriptional regulator with XRE-family HTH domain
MSKTQPELARLAGVSLSTVIRWMKDPDSVSAENRAKLERANSMKTTPSQLEVEKFDRVWSRSRILTPRQAFVIDGTIEMWQDFLQSMFDSVELYEISPFDLVDSRALFSVAGNKLWVKHAGSAMQSHHKMLTNGMHPVEHTHSFFDELLFALAVADAPSAEEHYQQIGIEMPGEIPLGDELEEDADDAPWDDWDSPMERILSGWSPVSAELAALLPFDQVDPHLAQPDISEVSVPHPFEWFNKTIDSWWADSETDLT